MRRKSTTPVAGPSSSSATKPARIRLLIVDDDDSFRYAIRQWLESCTRFEVVGEARDGMEAVRLVGECLPDIVLMDISMPSMNGLEATAHLTQRFPQVRVVIHTVSTNPQNVRKALQAGAAAYLVKASNTRLALVIDEVAAGKTYVDSSVPMGSIAKRNHVE